MFDNVIKESQGLKDK